MSTGTQDVVALIGQVREATERLVATIAGLGVEQLAAPSLLPGWSRAHLLTHVARNADGARNLLLALRSGQEVRMYPSPAVRAADIEAGAGRPPDVIVADAIESSRRFVVDAECMSGDRWSGRVPFSSGSQGAPTLIPGMRPLDMRLREIEFHHVDLDAGYGFGSSPAPLLEGLLADTIERLSRQDVLVVSDDGGRGWTVESEGHRCSVNGDRSSLLAWLSGRSDGAGLSADLLPSLPSLG